MLFQVLKNQDMIRNEREKTLESKQQGITITNHQKPPTSSTTTSSRSWSGGLKNPRIVRVSRAFGGKDRHSKVTTVKGLRDRRVRLSVPTAIQLYDLQDRLGLNQPSKVIDWLINAAQSEIDKLPPLHFPPEDHDLMAQLAPTPRPEEPKAQTDVQALSHDHVASFATYYQWEGANAYLSQPIMSIPYFCPAGIFGSAAVNVSSAVQPNLEMNSFDHISGTLARQFE